MSGRGLYLVSANSGSRKSGPVETRAPLDTGAGEYEKTGEHPGRASGMSVAGLQKTIACDTGFNKTADKKADLMRYSNSFRCNV